MSKEDVINYVMNTPHNPNRAVLEGMLEDSGGGSGDCGYSCTETRELLIEESVTTEASEQGNFAQGEFSDNPFLKDGTTYFPDTIVVTFNGTEYICSFVEGNGYGVESTYDEGTGKVTFDWSEYPFGVSGSYVATENAGTYSIKIEIITESVETSECFEKAVKKITSEEDDIFIVGYRDVGGGAATFAMDKTYNEIREAFVSKKKIIVGNLNGDDYYGTGTVLGIRIYNSQYRVQTSIANPKSGGVQFAEFYASSADSTLTFSFD